MIKSCAANNICQINLCHVCPTVSVRVRAHEGNYYGSIKRAGVVTERKLGQENVAHFQKWDTKQSFTPLCFRSYAGRVVGSTFDAKRQNPEVSVRNIDPGLKGVKLRLEQLTQVHESPKPPLDTHQIPYRRSLYCSISDPNQADHIQQHIHETYMTHI